MCWFAFNASVKGTMQIKAVLIEEGIASAVKRLIVINRIQNKSFCLHKICM